MKSLFKKLFPNLVAGQKYEEWKKETYSLQSTKIKNKKLAQELERACVQKGGILTFSEFLEIDQFGKHGYHATHSARGFTPSFRNWGKALALLCKQNNIRTIIDYGCGNGNLGVEAVLAGKKEGIDISWVGIERNATLHSDIIKNFKKKGIEKNLHAIYQGINKIKNISSSLFVLSYSIDNIPSDIFVNTRSHKNFPDTMIGITVKNGLLVESYLSHDILQKKGIFFKEGIYKDSFKHTYTLHKWNLFPFQRAYIQVRLLSLLAHIAQKFSTDSHLLLLDEFKKPPQLFSVLPLSPPAYLNRGKNRYVYHPDEAYHHAGEWLYYFPAFLNTVYFHLESLGFKYIAIDADREFPAKIEKGGSLQKNVSSTEVCYALLCSQRKVTIPSSFIIAPPHSPKNILSHVYSSSTT